MLELAKESDFEAVNRLARQVTAHHAQWDAGLKIVDETYPREFFLECIKENAIYQNAIYVARKDGVVVGYMRFYLWQTNSAVTEKRYMLSIDDFGVEKSLRGQGIGTEMMNSLRLMAKEWGVSGICLYVDEPNDSAQSFYKKQGFRIRNLGMRVDL